MQVAVGTIVEGKIAKITNYGAFVDLDGSGTGMIHISEIANTYVKDINDHVKLGDTVTVKVIGINEQGKVSLSIKEMQAKQEPSAPQQFQGKPRNGPRPSAPRSFNRAPAVQSTGDPFEDMMNKFKKTSDDKLYDLKKVTDPRKGSSRRSHTK